MYYNQPTWDVFLQIPLHSKKFTNITSFCCGPNCVCVGFHDKKSMYPQESKYLNVNFIEIVASV